MIPTVRKKFDCVEMKRKLQERVTAQTQGMSPAERMAHTQQAIANSRFARFMKQPAG